MSLFDAMTIASTSLTAQTASAIRLRRTWQTLIRWRLQQKGLPRQPCFYAVLEGQIDPNDASQLGVMVEDIVEVGGPARQEFNPEHPLADENGYIYRPALGVNSDAEMMQASRSFQNSVEAINTAKQLFAHAHHWEVVTMINNTPSQLFTSLNPNQSAEASRSQCRIWDLMTFGAHDCADENQDPTKPMDQMAFMSQLAGSAHYLAYRT